MRVIIDSICDMELDMPDVMLPYNEKHNKYRQNMISEDCTVYASINKLFMCEDLTIKFKNFVDVTSFLDTNFLEKLGNQIAREYQNKIESMNESINNSYFDDSENYHLQYFAM